MQSLDIIMSLKQFSEQKLKYTTKFESENPEQRRPLKC